MEPDSSLNQLERELYAKKENPEGDRSPLHGSRFRVAHTWQDQTNSTSTYTPMAQTSTKNWYKKFFFGALILFIISIGALGFSLLGPGNNISRDNVSVEVLGKTYADGGEPLTLQVTMTNKNPVAIELANLVLEYPDAEGTVTLRRSIGTIPAKQTHTEEFLLKLYGQEGSTKNLSARLEYRVHNSNAIFEQIGEHQIVLRSSPLRLTVETPETAVARQKFNTTITVNSNSTETIQGVVVSLQYPSDYNFESANPTPTRGTNIWDFGDMTPGATKTLVISGSLAGSSGEGKAIQVTLGSSAGRGEGNISTIFETKIAQIGLEDAFLGTSIVVNGQKANTVTVPAGRDINVEIAYRNTLSTTIREAEISAIFSGNAFDPSGVTVQGGFYDSSKRAIIWSSDVAEKLQTIPPGGEGSFSFKLISKQVGGSSPISDPSITIDTSIKGITNGETQSVDKGASAKVSIGTIARLEAETKYSTGVFQNAGPTPPKVNKETTYTLTWKVSNSSNTLSGVVVSAKLPTNVTWKNNVAPITQSESIQYNEATRTVTWNVGTVARGVGFGSSPKAEASFQVAITPSQSQVGERAPLTGEVLLSGTDNGTNAPVQLSRPAMTTRITGEGSGPQVEGQVVP